MIVCVYIWGVGKDPPRIQRGKIIMDFIHCHSQISLSGGASPYSQSNPPPPQVVAPNVNGTSVYVMTVNQFSADSGSILQYAFSKLANISVAETFSGNSN